MHTLGLPASPTVSSKPVGQVGRGTLWVRPIGNRPGAGPRKLFRRCDQTRIYRVHFDVAGNLCELCLISYQTVIAFVLPEGFSGVTKHLVALSRRKPFERLHHFGNRNMRSDEQMNVVRHHDKGVEIVLSRNLVSVVNGFVYQPRDFRAAQMQRAGLSVIQKTVHRKECFSGCGC